MSLQQEDSIMPLALPPPRSMRVLKSRERSTRRDSISPLHNQTSANSSSLGLLLGALCALILLALPLPLLLDGSVSIGPRAGLLAMFFVPPAILMAIVQLRYGESKTD